MKSFRVACSTSEELLPARNVGWIVRSLGERGILGAVTWRQEPPEGQVRSALSELDHRGPDARSVEVLEAGEARCVLGHTRLRIIDLDPRADQPLPNEDSSVWLVYNGELYNHRELRSDLERAGHRFRSNSDTEVIVHLYEQYRDSPAAMLRRLRPPERL